MKEIEMWAARDKNGILYLYREKPRKWDNQWHSDYSPSIGLLVFEGFPEIKWSDEEPTKVKLVIDKPCQDPLNV